MKASLLFSTYLVAARLIIVRKSQMAIKEAKHGFSSTLPPSQPGVLLILLKCSVCVSAAEPSSIEKQASD